MTRLIAVLAMAVVAGCISPPAKNTMSRGNTYSANEYDVRMAICLTRIKHVDGEVWFVDESELFLEDLKKRSGVAEIRHASVSRYDEARKRPVDQYTGETGFDFSISDVLISGDRARASTSWYASPLGGEWWTVTLRKENGQWVVSEWKLEAAS